MIARAGPMVKEPASQNKGRGPVSGVTPLLSPRQGHEPSVRRDDGQEPSRAQSSPAVSSG